MLFLKRVPLILPIPPPTRYCHLTHSFLPNNNKLSPLKASQPFLLSDPNIYILLETF